VNLLETNNICFLSDNRKGDGNKQIMIRRKQLQEDQYIFPYHHIPNLNESGEMVRYRVLDWSFKYFCYLLHIKDKIEYLRPKSILDVGCGDGRLLGILDTIETRKRVGVDLSKRSVMFAKAFYPEVEFYNKDANEIEQEFDVVVAMEVLEHVPDEDVSCFLRTLGKRARKGGHVIISVPTLLQPLNKKHYRHYNLGLLRKEVENARQDLQIVNAEYIYRESFWLKQYRKITSNRFWFLEIKPANRIVWKCIWKHLRFADERTGHNLVVTLKK